MKLDQIHQILDEWLKIYVVGNVLAKMIMGFFQVFRDAILKIYITLSFG